MLEKLKRFIKQNWPNQTTGWLLYRDLVLNRDSYLHTTGWLRSLRQAKPLDANGTPVPWMNYPVVQLLAERLPRDAVLFEFGSGHSTAFWARHVAQVHSIEYDSRWLDLITPTLPANATVRYCEQDRDGHYCRSLAAPCVLFDVVVIDGRDRVNCVLQALSHLADGGVIILDDSSREKYRSAFEATHAAGYKALTITGLKPTGLGTDTTTIFYRPGNCLGL